MLTLKGLLCYNILAHALMKRYRINFGIDKRRKSRMAVPFKAKDIASDSTEFGHSDVAILLT